MNLDILYAVTARPPRQATTPKKQVKKVSDSAVISADNHQAPQTPLPPASLSRKQLAQANSNADAKQATSDNTNVTHIDIEI